MRHAGGQVVGWAIGMGALFGLKTRMPEVETEVFILGLTRQVASAF